MKKQFIYTDAHNQCLSFSFKAFIGTFVFFQYDNTVIFR